MVHRLDLHENNPGIIDAIYDYDSKPGAFVPILFRYCNPSADIGRESRTPGASN